MDGRELDKQIHDLIYEENFVEAERILMGKYEECRQAEQIEQLDEVLRMLAFLFYHPENEDLGKAERYYLEKEQLRDDPIDKWSTSLFYLYSGQMEKVIAKADEVQFVERPECDDDAVLCERHNYYSCQTVKGQALLALRRIDETRRLIEGLVRMVKDYPDLQEAFGRKVNPLAFGDEINFMEVAIEVPELRSCAKELLTLVTPRIGDKEFRMRGQRLLKRMESLP